MKLTLKLTSIIVVLFIACISVQAVNLPKTSKLVPPETVLLLDIENFSQLETQFNKIMGIKKKKVSTQKKISEEEETKEKEDFVEEKEKEVFDSEMEKDNLKEQDEPDQEDNEEEEPESNEDKEENDDVNANLDDIANLFKWLQHIGITKIKEWF